MPAVTHHGSATDFFLKIDCIEGESKDAKHKGEIDIESWSWGETNKGTMADGGGGGAGLVSMQDFSFTMRINKATPKLILACAEGEHIKKATLIARKQGRDQQEYFTINFYDVLISSYQTKADGTDHLIPHAEVALNFAKIDVEYREQMSNGQLGGPIKITYDLKQRKRG